MLNSAEIKKKKEQIIPTTQLVLQKEGTNQLESSISSEFWRMRPYINKFHR